MIKAILIDLSGTLHVESCVVPGAVEALRRLRSYKFYIRFVTNTTKENNKILFDRLTKMGFKIEDHEIFSSLRAARELIINNRLKPMLFLSPEATEDFADIAVKECDKPNAVVIGLARSEFHYDKLNVAFRHLLDGAQLIGIHTGRYYKRQDGLSLGPGLFIKGLEFAANCEATIVGKPNKNFFYAAMGNDYQPEECIMIGDDVYDDIIGAEKCGMQAILVKTGKYRPGDEDKICSCSSCVLEDFPEAVEKIIKEHGQQQINRLMKM